MRWLLRFYPAAWRERYEEEFGALLDDCPRNLSVVVDLLLGALDAHLSPQPGNRRIAPMGIAPRGQTAPMGGEPPPASLRWQARPWLLALGVATLVPELTIWSTAAMQALGLGRPYAAVAALLPPPDAALALRRAVGWSLTLVAPALAAMLSFLAYVDVELRAGRGEISGRLRLAAPSSRRARLLAALVLLAGLLLFSLMSGHLIADCVWGGDCLRS